MEALNLLTSLSNTAATQKRLVVASIFLSYDSVAKVVEMWRAHSQSELIIIGFCLNKQFVYDKAPERLISPDPQSIASNETNYFQSIFFAQNDFIIMKD